ncbi:MAG TPA: hypothetical protein VHA11_08220 [Bryobacteraceae bacterium]|nr:hypothetical protein [Bryobacteraceae bacterium]
MFFRRVVPKLPTFEERLAALRQAGFETASQPDGRVKVSKNGCAALVAGPAGDTLHIERAGRMIGNDIALLVDGGYQKFWRVGKERKAPALAGQLKALHAFEEDLREALGVDSLYNTSLGTTNDLHLYDRVEGRDTGVTGRPWQINARS